MVRGSPLAALVHEDADDETVGALGDLAWTVDVEVAQADGFETVDASEVTGVELAHQLLAGVRVERVGGHVLGQRQGRLVAVDGGGGRVDDAADAGATARFQNA